MRTSNGYARRVLIAVGIAAAVVLLILALWAASHVLFVIFGGILLAVLLRGLGDLLGAGTGIPAGFSLAIVVAALAAVIIGGGWYLSGDIAGQFDQLGENLTFVWQQVREQLQKYAWGREILWMLGAQETSADKADAVRRILAGTLGGISGLVISLFIGVYVAADPTLYRQGLLRLAPLRSRKRAAEILEELHDTLRWWLMGTLAVMTAVGIATAAGLWLLGVPHPLALGIIMFFLEFVPYVGPILAAVPAVLIASTVGTREILFVILLYWGVQSIEGYLLSPLVYQRSVRIPPMLTISAQIILGALFGVLGVVFATPLTACALVLVHRLYIEDVLGDRLDKPLS